MARRVSLTWTNAYLVNNLATIPGLIQEVERKIGAGVWEETLIEPIAGEGNAFTAEDTDLEATADTYQYRVVIINGAVRTEGTVISVEVLAPAVFGDPVTDLDGQYVDEGPLQ